MSKVKEDIKSAATEIANRIVNNDEIHKDASNQNQEIINETSDTTNSLYGVGIKYENKKKNHDNKKDNYTMTIKIDADIDDYLKNIEKIVFIESIKNGKIESITRTEFINNLIREQMYKLIDADIKDNTITINNKWIEYKQKNNL